MRCRHCGSELDLPFLDLGSAPYSNAYLTEPSLRAAEAWFPLRVLVCRSCWLVQTGDEVAAEALFNEDYAYFSSFSEYWLRHAEAYVAMMVDRFGLGDDSMVVEIAANDGYLLQYVRARGIPCLGIEPTASTARAARQKGIEIIEAFFGTGLGAELSGSGRQADLVTANNVLAHVPDINDFLSGISTLLKPDGVATFEFPHLLSLVRHAQFDTIYHEHFSYLSMTALKGILEKNHLRAVDLENLNTHGGSLRVFAQRADAAPRGPSPSLLDCLEQEAAAGIWTNSFYTTFQSKADAIKNQFLAFLLQAKQDQRSVVGYGAAAKGNTLLNYAGVRPDLISQVVDRNPAKQGKYLPGSRIPICDEAVLKNLKPDFIVILPWNLRDEVVEQLDYVREWGGRFVTAVPSLQVI
jgi:SAM-dependent methyltransferase